MTARTSLEEALNFLVNEDHESAVKAFHEFVVKKAQGIHESLLEEDDLDNDIDEAVDEENVDEAKDEEVDESADKDEVDESADKEEVDEDDSEEVDESFGMDRSSIRSDEYFGRDELATEDDEEGEMDMGGDELAADDLGDEMGGDDMGGEEVTLSPEDADDMRSSMDELQAKFDELFGGGEEMGMEPEMDMGMDMGDEGGMDDMAPEEESFSPTRFESDEPELDEGEEEVDEAITHDAGVVGANHGVDHDGKGGSGDSVKHNSDAKLPEGAEFDFDLTEEDFLDLEEGLKNVDVKMGGEQGGGKFAGEETQTKSPVAQRDKSDIKAGSKDMISTRDDHSGYKLETAPGTGNLPHSGDNSHDSMDGTGSPKRSEVSKGGGLDAQKGYGEGEVGDGKFAGTETNVKSIIGSAGTRNES